MRKRSHYWEHESGVEATVECLVLIFQSCLGLIVEQNCNIYSTTAWKTEIDQDKLLYNKILLQKLLELDPRGCFLAQVVVKDALNEALGKSGDLASIMAHQLPGMENGEEVIGYIAYKIRVMLSHLRQIQDGCTKRKNKNKIK